MKCIQAYMKRVRSTLKNATNTIGNMMHPSNSHQKSFPILTIHNKNAKFPLKRVKSFK